MSGTILIVDDEREIVALLTRYLDKEGYSAMGAYSGAEALALAKERNFDLMFTDLQMPEMDGIALLKEMRSLSPSTITVVVTGHATVGAAVAAMKAGAFDFVTKPLELEEMRLIAKRALEYRRLQSENLTLKKQLKKKYRFKNLIGDSPLMEEVFRLIERVASTDSTVLITGETGTGKELVARAIHYNSDRREKYLVPVNCGAIPETLLESELFGHVKGAFTGASTNRIGRFEAAEGGTIFLDEIGDMSPNLQVKVLRVLQNHEFEPVGMARARKVDVRVLAATNINLEAAIAEKAFRKDLFYRLNVIPINVPPLRDRRVDIPLLVNHFLEIFREEKMRDVKPLPAEVMAVFMGYDWPGNVRELENLIERLVILSDDGVIRLSDLPEKIHQKTGVQIPASMTIPDEGLDFNTIVGEFEDKLILSALDKSHGNKNLAARLLNLKRTTLVEKIKKKGLDIAGRQDDEAVDE